MMNRKHIELVLGIDLKLHLNENKYILSEEVRQTIISEQLIFESFIDSLKKYAGEKWNKVVDTIRDWKDAAVILGKVLSDANTLNNFAINMWKTFISGDLNKLKQFLQKIKLGNLIPKIDKFIQKVASFQGWKKFMAVTAITSIAKYIIEKLASVAPENITKWITSYFSEEAIGKITSKLTDFTSYVSWLQPIIQGTEILFKTLKPTIDKFKFAIDLAKQNNPQAQNQQITNTQTQNQGVLTELRKTIRKIIENEFSGEELTNKKYKLRHPKTNTIVFVDVDKVLDKHGLDSPEFDIRIKKNQIGNRIDKAKNYIKDYIDDDRWIHPKTGKRQDNEFSKMNFEPSVAYINNGKLGFEDGRHRILAAKELGLKTVALEVPKDQVDLFKELQ